MKKIIKITIGKTVFLIEDDAYQKLDVYLESIRKHYRFDEGGEGIVDDIENSIAEKFITRGFSADSSIGLKEVQDIITEMGTIEELLEESTIDTDKEEESYGSKRLYRDTEDVVIAGVASGVARYLKIDPIIIRLIFGISVFFGGFGIFAYILLWAIIPAADTASKKIRMDGGSATVSEIETFVKQKVADVPKKKWKKILSFPFIIIKKIFVLLKSIISKLGPILTAIIGGAIALSTLIALFAFSTSYAVLLSGTGVADPILTIIIESLSQNFFGIIVYIGIYLIVVIPLILIILLGVSLVRRKRTLGWIGVAIFFVIWFISVNVVAIQALPHVDQIEETIRQAESELDLTMAKQTYEDLVFDDIDIGGNFKVFIKKGDVHSVLVEGSEQAIEDILVEVEDGELDIDNDKGFFFCMFFCQDLFSRTKIIITTPNLGDINFSGSVVGETDEFQAETVQARFSGDSDFIIRVISNKLEIRSSGSGSITLLGKTDDLSLRLSGSSRIHGYDMLAQKTFVKSSGSSRVELSLEENLEVRSSGSSRVSYIDHANVTVEEHSSGSGRVIEVLPEVSDIQE